MLSLPLITPRDSHELWFGSAHPSHSNHHQSHPNDPPNRRPNTHPRTLLSSTPQSTLSALLLEERALRARKHNIASFGYTWIKPAGCPKTMLGMKEEEAEREETLASAAAAEAEGGGVDEFGDMRHAEGGGEGESGMERDLDDDVPDADAEEIDEEGDGLVEEGEEALEEDDVDEEGYMERDLDDDIPEGFDDGGQEDYGDDFDNQPDLDDDVPVAAGEGMSDNSMVRDLDEDIPEAETGSAQEEEWQHTDSEAELDDDEDSFHDPFAAELRSSTNSRGPPLPPIRREIETEAQRRFLQRWSGGGDALDSSMLVDEDDLRSSMASHSSRRSGFGGFSRRISRPRDSFDF